MTASLQQAYDDDIIGTTDAVTSGIPSRKGVYSRVGSQLLFLKRTGRTQVTADGGLSLDFYPDLGEGIRQPIDSYFGTAGATTRLGRSTIQASQTIAYQPYFGFDLMPAGSSLESMSVLTSIPGLRPDAALLTEPVITHATSATVGVATDRRSTLSFSYGYQGAVRSELWPTVDGQAAGVQFSRSTSRHIQFNAGYNYHVARYEGTLMPSGQVVAHDVHGGFSYMRPLSASRTITVSASGGGSTARDNMLTEDRTMRNVSARGGTNLQFARTWSVSADFDRSLQLLQGLQRPYYGNSMGFNIQGGITRRISIRGMARSVRSNPGGKLLRQEYITHGLSVRLQYALSENLAVSSEYMRAKYELGPDVVLPEGVLRRLDRNVVRVGLTFATMLVGR